MDNPNYLLVLTKGKKKEKKKMKITLLVTSQGLEGSS
jgi:hypothetical protein